MNTKLELTSMTIKRFKDNLTKREREPFVSLTNDLEIVIKKADKSNTIVVMCNGHRSIYLIRCETIRFCRVCLDKKKLI